MWVDYGPAARSTRRYLVALPSYEYLDHLSRSPDKPANFFAQSPAMDEREQLALLEQFQQRPSAVLGIVMGGVFAESVTSAKTRPELLSSV